MAVEERLAARLATGDAPGVVGDLDSAVRAEPYRERRWELLILALYRSGRQAEALAAVARAGRAFRELHTRATPFATDFNLFGMIDDAKPDSTQ